MTTKVPVSSVMDFESTDALLEGECTPSSGVEVVEEGEVVRLSRSSSLDDFNINSRSVEQYIGLHMRS